MALNIRFHHSLIHGGSALDGSVEPAASLRPCRKYCSVSHDSARTQWPETSGPSSQIIVIAPVIDGSFISQIVFGTAITPEGRIAQRIPAQRSG